MNEKLKQAIALGREHYANREYGKAERHLKHVVEAEQAAMFPDIHNMLGVIQHDRGNLLEAKAAFGRALAINPNYTEAALNLAVTCNDLGNYDEAQQIYRRALRRTEYGSGKGDRYARGKVANLHAEVAQAYLDMGLVEEAIKQYRAAVRLCPKFADLRVKLAEVYQQVGDVVSAKYELSEAIEARPEYTRARNLMGVVLLVTGHRDLAIAEWEKALSMDPDDRATQMYLRMAKVPPMLSVPPSESNG